MTRVDVVKLALGPLDSLVVHADQVSAIGEVLEKGRIFIMEGPQGILTLSMQQKKEKVDIPLVLTTGPFLIIHPMPVFPLCFICLFQFGFAVNHHADITHPDKNGQSFVFTDAALKVPGGTSLEDVENRMEILPELLVRAY